jgi:hypothetical protein
MNYRSIVSGIVRGVPGIFLLSCIVLAQAFAQTDTAKPAEKVGDKFTEEKIDLIEDNLVNDLDSPIIGVVIGGAQTVREMKKAVPTHDFAKLIIPLMRIVKDQNADRGARILAALALFDIDSERGNFAISREGEMGSDEVFKALCANLTAVRKAKTGK